MMTTHVNQADAKRAFALILCAALAFASFPAASIAAPSSGLVYIKAKQVKVSTFDDSPGGWAPPPNAMAVVDGDLSTRWASKAGDGQWIVLNFGHPRTVSSLVLHWERAYATTYAIESSNDGVAWQKVSLKKEGNGGVENLAFKPFEGTYMRLYVMVRANPQWGVSLWEIEPYGPADKNPGDSPIELVFPALAKIESANVSQEIPYEKPVPSPGPIDPNAFQRGVNYTSWHESELGTETSDRVLQHLKSKGVDHIALLTTWFQKYVDSKEIFPQSPKGGSTPTDNALRHAINTAHKLGIKVMLKPHLDIEEGTYRGELFPVEGWFPYYERFMLYYAKLAADTNCEMYSIGVELKGATTWEQEENWRKLIKKIRRIYKGPITYSANWDEYENVGFWDAVDYIGIDAYYPLTEDRNATLEQITAGWKFRADDLEAWLKQKKLNKPILFTELGYPSVDGANVQPWVGVSEKTDRQEQADCIDASFRVLSKRPWFKGIYWWHYFPKDRPLMEDLTLKGKLGEDVMANWHQKLATKKGETKK